MGNEQGVFSMLNENIAQNSEKRPANLEKTIHGMQVRYYFAETPNPELPRIIRELLKQSYIIKREK